MISAYQAHGDLKDYLEREDPPWDIRLQLVSSSDRMDITSRLNKV